MVGGILILESNVYGLEKEQVLRSDVGGLLADKVILEGGRDLRVSRDAVAVYVS